MSSRHRMWLGGLAVLALAVTVFSPAVRGQGASTKPRAARAGTVPRTAWGDPDLQGIWTNTTTTPLQRPDDLAGKAVLTDQEREERDRQTKARNVDQKPKAGETGAYNQFWFERGVWTNQTSLVVDPPDGKIPAMTEAAKKRLDAQVAHRKAHPADSWLDRGPYDRCITRGMPGAMVPGFYNHNYQIFQTKDYVAILIEMIHDARIVALDGRPHAGERNGSWLGSSRGRWEGDTLVIETRNMTDKLFEFPPTVAFGTGRTMTVVERFKRVDADTIDYQFTVNDPTAFTKPWTVSTPMTKTDGPIFEYACHEGNHAMAGILSAERTLEKDAASGR